jgi:hypothetical protein
LKVKKKGIRFPQSKLHERLSLASDFAYVTDISSSIKLTLIFRLRTQKSVNLQAMKLIIHKEGEFVEKVFREKPY